MSRVRTGIVAVGVVVIAMTFGSWLSAAGPASAAASESTAAEREQILAVLQTIRDEDPATLDAAEDALVKLGDAARHALPAMLDDPKAPHQEMLAVAAFRLAHGDANPRQALAGWVKKSLKGQELRLAAMPATHAALRQFFPDSVFYTWTAHQFPVARMVPEPLSNQNIFVVDSAGNVEQLTTRDGLEKWFKAHLPGLKGEADAKQALCAWLTLTVEFSQDGMLRFAIDEASIEAKGVPTNLPRIDAKGAAKVTEGGRGGVSAAITFVALNGDIYTLERLSEQRDIKAGMRPICQATKLLDPDPIVRKMAEQDILVMGRACRWYLLEQRAKASPDLQRAIDAMWERILKREAE